MAPAVSQLELQTEAAEARPLMHGRTECVQQWLFVGAYLCNLCCALSPPLALTSVKLSLWLRLGALQGITSPRVSLLLLAWKAVRGGIGAKWG